VRTNGTMLPVRALLVRTPAVLVGVWLAASAAGALHRAVVNTSPDRVVVDASPADFDLPFEDAAFPTRDGLVLRGWWIPSTTGAAVVCAHGLGQTRAEMLPRAAALARAGFGVLLFDLRAHGASDGDRFPTSWRADEDVLAATAYVLGRPDVDPGRVGAHAFSVGASATLRAAARDGGALRALFLDGVSAASIGDQPAPRGVVELALLPFELLYAPALVVVTGVPDPGPQTPLLDALADRPIFWVATGPARRQEARRMARYAARAPSTVGTWIVEETGHGGAHAARPAEYDAALTSFFAGVLLDGDTPYAR
jgi:uncharacterized protein